MFLDLHLTFDMRSVQSDGLILHMKLKKDKSNKRWRLYNDVDRFLMKIPKSLSHTSSPSTTVARLVWADFPTGLRVVDVDVDVCPTWNNIGTSSLIRATLRFSGLFMADEGWFVCLSLLDHLPKIHKIGRKVGLVMHRMMSLQVDSSYLYDNGEQVETLALTMF